MIDPPHRHLCVTHSPLVTRVFQAVSRGRKIPDSSIHFIARRGMSVPGSGLCLDATSNELDRCFKKFDRKGYCAAWKEFDEALRELTGGLRFEAYIPHANKILYQEIISHPLCAGYSFLEEGFTSMEWNTWPNARSTFSKMLRNHLRTWWVHPKYRFMRPMFDHASPKYRAAYAISPRAFLGMPGRTDVSAQVPLLPAADGPGNTYVILDAGYLHLGIRWEDYEDALVAAILKRALPGGEVLVKFHFADAQAPQRFESIRRRLAVEGGPEPRILGPEFSVDDNLTREDLVLFALTSLGYYTALAGGRVECFAGEIKGVALDSWITGHRLPADFRQVVGLSDGE